MRRLPTGGWSAKWAGMRAFIGLFALSVTLVACPTEEANPNLPSCDLPDSEELAPGNFRATINDSLWEAPAVPPGNPWQLSGTGFQTSGSADGSDMTIRLTSSSRFEEQEDGSVDKDLDDPIQDVFDDMPVSVDFQLGNQAIEGGDTSLTINAVTHHTNQDGGGGFLRLSFQAGDDEGSPALILGCFDYTAGEAGGGETAVVSDGAFVLAQ